MKPSKNLAVLGCLASLLAGAGCSAELPPPALVGGQPVQVSESTSPTNFSRVTLLALSAGGRVLGFQAAWRRVKVEGGLTDPAGMSPKTEVGQAGRAALRPSSVFGMNPAHPETVPGGRWRLFVSGPLAPLQVASGCLRSVARGGAEPVPG
jgi:hypothetical protein